MLRTKLNGKNQPKVGNTLLVGSGLVAMNLAPAMMSRIARVIASRL
jgi:hypothetical protein